jgi:Flp pilus assembly pilin Flp
LKHFPDFRGKTGFPIVRSLREDLLMKSIKKFSKRLCKNERGQGMVEYILLLVLVVAAIALFKPAIMSKVKDLTGKFSDGVDNATSDLGGGG